MATLRALVNNPYHQQIKDTDHLSGGALSIYGSGLDRATAAALAVGGVNASSVDISQTGALSTVKGGFQVDQASALVGAVTITGFTGTNGGVGRSTVGIFNVGADAFTTTINVGTGAAILTANFGTGAAITDLNFGRAGQSADFLGSVNVAGNLVVSGTTTSVDSETVLLADNHMYLNHGYETVAAQTGGLVVNREPTATNDAVAAGGFATTSTIATTGAATFAAGDIIQVAGATNATNNGLFRVLTHAANVLTIDVAPADDFLQNVFVVSVGAVGTIRKVNISVLRSNTAGTFWEVAFGAVSPVTFSNLTTAAGATLQAAYEAGNTATTSAGEGNFTITGDQDFVVAGTVDISITSTGSITATALTGAVNINTTGNVDLIGGTSLQVGDDVATLDFNGSGAVSESNMTSFSITPSAAITFTAGAASSFTTSAGALTITSAAAATWSTAAGPLTLNGTAGFNAQAAGTSRITISTGGTTNISAPTGEAVNINTVAGTAATNIHVVPTGTIAIGHNAAGQFTISGGSLFTGTFGGTITLLSNGGNISLASTTGTAALAGATTTTISSGTTLDVTAGTTLNLDGTTGLSLQFNGSDVITLTAATGTITGTLVIGTGNSLSLDGNLNGSDVNATNVTGTNLNTLNAGAGSNADGLHAHALLIGALAGVTISGLTTTGVGSGFMGYVSSNNTLTLTDADVLASSYVVGVNTGTAGSMQVNGVVTLNMTTAGLNPGFGGRIYLATATEEASAAGKGTGTAPSGSGDSIVLVAICTDDTNYAGAKTVKARLVDGQGALITVA